MARARRPRLGQHFLISSTILDRIARAVDAAAGASDLIIEIGPGTGALTARLLATGRRVLAIEIDSRLVAALRRKFDGQPGFELLEADFLTVDIEPMIRARAPEPAVVAGNLPYYITSPILRRIFDAAAAVSHAVVLMQKEVAWRIIAQPGARDFAYLSVLCQTHSRPELLFTVPPGAFRPAPKVTSALVRFTIEPRWVAWGISDREAFLEFAQLCFRQKRKTLRNNLQGKFDRERLGERPETQMRAEQLGAEGLARLWLSLASNT